VTPARPQVGPQPSRPTGRCTHPAQVVRARPGRLSVRSVGPGRFRALPGPVPPLTARRATLAARKMVHHVSHGAGGT
jgi:hypothetical protein